jgi:hypothetical protein
VLVIGLNDRDFIKQPARAAGFGQIFRAVGVQDAAVDGMAMKFSGR